MPPYSKSRRLCCDHGGSSLRSPRGGRDTEASRKRRRAHGEATREAGANTHMAIQLGASKERPVVNPVLVAENWGSDQTADLLLNGSKIPATMDVRQGVVSRPNGVNALVVWIETTLRQPSRFEIRM